VGLQSEASKRDVATEAGQPSRRPGTPAFRARRLLLFTLAVSLGAAFGIGAFTFRYAEGFSYLSTEPRACVNCHIMRPQYDGWQKASHHAVAVCVDCHLPHEFLPKYVAKLENGWRHSKEFTAGTFAEPIFVKPRGREILEQNCVRCHDRIVAEMDVASADPERRISCVRCHASVGHGDAARLGGRLRPEEKQGTKP
jgi:cytochrome c nitrite reductase small subunit